MTLTGRRIIQKFVNRHRDSHQWLAEWIRNVETAQWRDVEAIRKLYPATDGGVRMNNRKLVTVFNVKGNEYRLIADIVYAAQLVNVLDLMTHAEYSKDLWKSRRY